MLKKDYAKQILIDFIIIFSAILAITVVMLNTNWIQSLDGDNAPQTYAIYSLVGKALHNGELPLWNPYIWGGISNIGAPITEAFYPINWILCYIFYNVNTGVVSYAIITFNLIFHISLYFCGCYYLLKKIGVKQVWAAMLALLSICCFPFASYFTWIVYFNGFCWFPLLTLSAIKLIEARDKISIFFNIIVLGMLFAMEALISVSLMLTITAFFIVVLFLAKIILDKKKRIMQCLKLFLAAIIGIMLSMPVIVETVQFLLHSARYVDDGFLYGMSKVSFDSFVAHKVSFEDAENLINVLPVNSWLSIGGVLFVLGIIGIFVRSKNKQYLHGWSVFGLVFCILYCFGYIVPDFVYYIPFLNNLRETYMYACVIDFLITILAGYGINAISEVKINENFSSKIYFWKIILGIIVICITYNILPHKLPSTYEVIMVVLFFVFLILLNINRVDKRISMCIIFIATVVSVYAFIVSFGQRPLDEVQAIKQVDEVNSYNQKVFSEFVQEESSRIIQVGNSSYPTNQGAVLGIKEGTNYFNPSSEIAIKCNTHIDFLKRSQLHNIKYWLINTNNDESFISWWELAYPNIAYVETVSLLVSWDSVEPSDVMLYESDSTLGCAWVVSNIDYYSEDEEDAVFAWLNDSQTHLDEEVKINKDRLAPSTVEQLETINTDNGSYCLNAVDYGFNKIIYNVTSENKGVLVTSELYDQGWKVYVNGMKQEVLNVDYSNRAVIIPEGNSVVEFVYRPNGFIFGSIIQIMMLSIIIGSFVYFYCVKKRCANFCGSI